MGGGWGLDGRDDAMARVGGVLVGVEKLWCLHDSAGHQTVPHKELMWWE